MPISLNRADERLRAMVQWLPVPVRGIEVVAGDASRRRYFRIHTPDQSLIAMDAPPPENPGRFVEVAAKFAGVGVRVPEIHAFEAQRGFVLLEDFGDRSYLSCLRDDTAGRLYGQALDTLFGLQTRCHVGEAGFPLYTESLLRNELGIFREWLLERWLGLAIDPELWHHSMGILVRHALEQPQVCVHRDYHSRNLMVVEGQGPGVLDFQDAVVGPVTYDLVSLLRDCYLSWPREQVAAWRESYRQRLAGSGLEIDPELWRRWFDLMGAQRHLKAAGIFARLWVRDRRPGYLADIPRTLEYVLAVCLDYEPLRPLGCFLEERVLPAVKVKLCRR